MQAFGFMLTLATLREGCRSSAKHLMKRTSIIRELMGRSRSHGGIGIASQSKLSIDDVIESSRFAL
jgi:hypothetical protein